MTLLQLKYAVTAATAGTISEAAKQLFITQPSLTSAIHELENELASRFFSAPIRAFSSPPREKNFSDTRVRSSNRPT